MTERAKIGLFVRGLHNGGIEKVFESYYAHMDLSNYEVHVITHMENDQKKVAVFEQMGCKVHELSKLHGHKITEKNINEYCKLFKEIDFKIVHNNTPDNLLALYFAKRNNVPIRILHAHNVYSLAYQNRNCITKKLYRLGFDYNATLATSLIAVSREAALSAFGQREYVFLPNAIETKKFKYDERVRKVLRDELNLSGTFCIGHVGRYEGDV